MRKAETKYLISYILFIGVSILISFLDSKNNQDLIKEVVFAVSIASMCISIGDIFYSKASIDRIIRLNYMKLMNTYDNAIYRYENNLEKKYKEKAEEILRNMGENDLKDLDKHLEECDKNEDLLLQQCFNKGKLKEKVFFLIGDLFYIGGLAFMLILISFRDKYWPENLDFNMISNVITLISFITVLSNILLRTVYRASDWADINDEKRKLKNIEDN